MFAIKFEEKDRFFLDVEKEEAVDRIIAASKTLEMPAVLWHCSDDLELDRKLGRTEKYGKFWGFTCDPAELPSVELAERVSALEEELKMAHIGFQDLGSRVSYLEMEIKKRPIG